MNFLLYRPKADETEFLKIGNSRVNPQANLYILEVHKMKFPPHLPVGYIFYLSG